jgi:hypothetical protein
MVFFGIDSTKMVRWVCTPGAGGEVMIEDPVREVSWVVKPTEMVVKVVAVGPTGAQEAEADEEPPPSKRVDTPIAPDAPPPPPVQMMRSSLFRELPPELPAELEPEPLAERMFDVSLELAGASPDDACKRMLEIVVEFIPVEAASLARGTELATELRYVAAHGPIAEKILGQSVPVGEGIIGLCFEARSPVQAYDAQKDDRHLVKFDKEFEFQTHGVLCVPVMNDESTFGVIQLINPKSAFLPGHIEALQTMARTLANVLAEASFFSTQT